MICSFCEAVDPPLWELCPERDARKHRLVPELRQATALGVSGERKRPAKGSRAGFTPASTAQRTLNRERVSIISGVGPVDPAHICPRGNGGCDDPLCTIPLTRVEHRAFDDGKLDVLPAMIAHGMWDEMAHAIQAHHMDPIALINRLTGDHYELARRAA